MANSTSAPVSPDRGSVTSRRGLVERFAGLFLAGALGLGAWLLLAAGPAPQLNYPSDVAAYLDACQRGALGQWLGRDFSSPIGPAALLPTVMAMQLVGSTVQALALGSALVWLAYGVVAWLAVRNRMPAWCALLFALFVAGTAAAPYTLDFGSWRILSYGMLYNRLAWAALCIAAGAALLPRTDGTAPRLVAAGLGACALWLWAIKPNYLLVLAPLILCHWLPGPRRAAGVLHGLAGALGMMLVVWLCVRFSPAGYLNTHLGMAVEAPSGLMVHTLLRSLRENAWIALGLLALWAVVLAPAPLAPVRVRLALALGAVIAATFAANMTNCQFAEIPLWGALGWLAAALAVRCHPRTWLARSALAAGVAIGLAFTWQPLAGLAYNYAWKHYRAPGAPAALAVAGPAWLGMPMRPVPGAPAGPAGALESAGNYAAWLNDGLALLARVGPARGAVLCLDWTNPFPFATRTAPVVGDEIAWHVGRTVGPVHHPDVARLVAGAAMVMEPRRSVQPDSLAFKRDLFAPALAAAFDLGGESPHWRLWVRRGPVPAPPPVPNTPAA